MNKAVKYLFLILLTCMLTFVPASVLADSDGNSGACPANLTYRNSNCTYSGTPNSTGTAACGAIDQFKTNANNGGYTAIPGSGGIFGLENACNYSGACANGACANDSCTDDTCANGACNNSANITYDDSDTVQPAANSYNDLFSVLMRCFAKDFSCSENIKTDIKPLIPQKVTKVTAAPSDNSGNNRQSMPQNDQPRFEVTGQTDQQNPEAAQFTDQYSLEVIDLVNQHRVQAGLNPLIIDEKLCQAAAIRAKEIQISFSHTRPDGRSCFTALTEVKASYMSAGENIAIGQANPQAVVTAWMNSPGHRANIMNPNFSRIGVSSLINNSRRYGGFAWAQFFAD